MLQRLVIRLNVWIYTDMQLQKAIDMSKGQDTLWSSALISYNMLKFVNPDPDQPPIIQHPMQRKENTAQSHALMAVAKEDGSGLIRGDPVHGIIVMVRREMIDPSCISLDASGEIKDVKFAVGVKGEVIVLDGGHRIRTLQKLLLPHMKQRNKLMNVLTHPGTAKGKKEELKASITRLNGITKATGYWCTIFLDQSMF